MKFVLTSSGMVEASPIDIKQFGADVVTNWLNETAKAVGNWLVDRIWHGWEWIVQDFSGPACLFVAMVFMLFAMFGSTKAARGTYWTVATYIIIQILGLAIRGY